MFAALQTLGHLLPRASGLICSIWTVITDFNILSHLFPRVQSPGSEPLADLGDAGRAPSNGPFAKYRWSKQTCLPVSVEGRQGGQRANQQAPPKKDLFQDGEVVVVMVMWTSAGTNDGNKIDTGRNTYWAWTHHPPDLFIAMRFHQILTTVIIPILQLRTEALGERVVCARSESASIRPGTWF